MNMHSLTIIALCFLCYILISSVPFVNQVTADIPNSPPFIDQCTTIGNQKSCETSQCVWSTKWYPMCVGGDYLSSPPPREATNSFNLNLADKFFVFNYGVHLSEGTSQQIYYNINVNECARQCLRSPMVSGRIRCLSFDFYPFENPITDYPYYEAIYTGICVLNSGNKDLARLRNEDQGVSDAELFYKSHFSRRPFSELDGYYELRDPRGGSLQVMLSYGAVNDEISTINTWGGSRWGIYHTSAPQPIVQNLTCPWNKPNPTFDVGLFTGVFTPVNALQQCPGLLTKTKAQALCQSAGGDLCSRDQLNLAQSKKIGCSLDTEAMWDLQSQVRSPNDVRYVRCCGSYGFSLDCSLYEQDNVDFCSKFTKPSDCIQQGSGYSLQITLGFGRFLDQIRNDCKDNPETKCGGAMIKDWAPRDKCVWCLKPGTADESDSSQGSCRPGTSFGICQSAESSSKQEFELAMKAKCGPSTICRLVSKFTDLRRLLS